MATVPETGRVSGFTLKMIAVVSMFIDHSAATILYKMLYYFHGVQYPIIREHWQAWKNVYFFMRGIGRFAFPIYCFLIVEGLLHTKNVKKYAFRLFLFAWISEIPFDLALQDSIWDMSYNNVFFTLFLGLVVIALVKYADEHWVVRIREKKGKRWAAIVQWGFVLLVSAAGMILAEYVLRSDYGAVGVLTIILLYLLHRRPVLAYLAAVIVLSLFSNSLELAALAMLPLIYFYNGQRGKQLKYFFYAFYPLHLLLLSGVCLLIFR